LVITFKVLPNGAWDLKNRRNINISKIFIKKAKNKELQSVITFEVLSNGSSEPKNRRKRILVECLLKKKTKKNYREFRRFTFKFLYIFFW
jgi:hypothetical protein